VVNHENGNNASLSPKGEDEVPDEALKNKRLPLNNAHG
jgi:hypothetical protein